MTDKMAIAIHAARLEEIEARTYGMFSKRGGEAVAKMVDAAAALPKRTSRIKIAQFVYRELSKIRKRYSDGGDTWVRECIVTAIFDRTGKSLNTFEIVGYPKAP